MRSLALKIYSFPSGAIYVSSRTSTSRYFQEKCEVSSKLSFLFILICPRIFCFLYRIITVFVTKTYWWKPLANTRMIFHMSKLCSSFQRLENIRWNFAETRREFNLDIRLLLFKISRRRIWSICIVYTPAEIAGARREWLEWFVDEESELAGLLMHYDVRLVTAFFNLLAYGDLAERNLLGRGTNSTIMDDHKLPFPIFAQIYFFFATEKDSSWENIKIRLQYIKQNYDDSFFLFLYHTRIHSRKKVMLY